MRVVWVGLMGMSGHSGKKSGRRGVYVWRQAFRLVVVLRDTMGRMYERREWVVGGGRRRSRGVVAVGHV